MTPPVIYIPIRHHSPACSRVVAQIIAEHRPSAVLVEGPPAFDDQIEFLVHPDARMPLAIYSHVTYDAEPASEREQQPALDNDADALDRVEVDGATNEPIRIGAYYPFCDYSPELVALSTGHSVGARLGFVDLEHRQFASYDSSPAGHANERRLENSSALTEAAMRLGCRDHNELWDQMVEAADLSVEETMAAVLAYGSLIRSGADPEQLSHDGTNHRELAMASQIAAVVRECASDTHPVVVVTGAFHTVALPALVEATLVETALNSSDQQETPGSNRVGTEPVILDHGHGLIRYTFDRLDALMGYAAGMPSPRWYQSLWEDGQDNSTATMPAGQRIITEVATTLRTNYGDGQPSLPTVVDAFVAAEQLSRLRNRRKVSRDDTVDAMVSCFTKGEDNLTNPVRQAAGRAMTGTALGALPYGTPRVPLAKDFDRMTIELGLPHDTSDARQVHLDVYRKERDRRRSRFLHGLSALGISYGICITPLRFSRVSGRDVIRERWRVQIDVSTDVSITEASIWGAGIEEAVAAKTRQDLEDLLQRQPSASELMKLVMTAAQRGVPTVVLRALDAVQRRLAVEPSMSDLVAALAEAELLWSAREPLGGSELTALPALAEQIYVRSCQLGRRAHEAPPEQLHETVKSLATLHRVLTAQVWEGLEEELFWDMLADQRDRVQPGILRGAICGLEWRGGRVDDRHVVTSTAAHLDPAAGGTVGGLFLAGLILVARDALWEIDDMARTITNAFAQLEEEQFLRRVPSLRSAFAALTPRQTDRLSDVVSIVTGSQANVRITGVEPAEVLRHSLDSAAVEAQLELDGLGDWMAR